MILDQLETITRRDIKRNNRLRIYHRLLESGKLSCLDISKDLELSLPTVGKNIATLEETHLVRSSEEKKNTGGRSSKIYEAVTDYRVAIGVNITNQHISAVAIDLQGKIIAHTRFRQKFVREDAYFQRIGTAVNEVVAEAQLTEEQILGVALVIPALLTKDGRSTYYNGVLHIDPIVECDEFSKYIPYSTHFYHDSSSAAYAESWYNPNITDFFYLMISDTICGAPILDGIPYHGLNNRSGEIGHINMIPGGKLCYCGKRGCMDPYCSTKVLSSLTGGDLALFFEQLEEKEESATARWQEYLQSVATAVNSVRMLFDCNIVIGGYLGQHIDKYMDDVRPLVQAADPFSDDVNYLSACVCKKEASASGGALTLIDRFVRTI